MENIELLRSVGGDRLAVIGLGVDFPGCRDLSEFYQATLAVRPINVDQGNWQSQGCLARAVQEARQGLAGCCPEIGMLVIGPTQEINTLRNQVDWAGPVLDFAGYQEALPSMLHKAQEWLESHTVDAVLLAGCSLSGTGALAKSIMGFDQSIHQKHSGSGAAAIIIMPLKVALQKGFRVYSVLESLAYSEPTKTGKLSDRISTCADAALKVAGVSPGEIGYLEALACGDDRIDLEEITGLVRIYNDNRPLTALGSGQARIGFLEGCNGIAGLVRAVMCLFNKLRPGAGQWSGPKDQELWQDSSFYVPVDSLTWFYPQHPGHRKAAVNFLGEDGSCGHLVISEPENQQVDVSAMRSPGLYLIPVGGNSPQELLIRLERVKSDLIQGFPVDRLSRETLQEQENNAFKVAILGHQSEEIQREIDFAVRGLPGVIEKGLEWQTPAGSYFTPRPLGRESKVAFVYPGAFNSYIGAGKDLFHLFPKAYNWIAQIAGDVGATLNEELLYPRSLMPLSKERLDQLEKELLADPITMMISGTSLSVVLTGVFRDIFQVQPDSGFGYSLGENSLLFAIGVWGDGIEASQRLRQSDLFRTRLAGPQNAVREYWGLPPLKSGETGKDLWANYLLMAPVDQVLDALSSESRVYLTHINTPRQVVIGGEPEGCLRIIERLKCNSLRAPFDYVLHCKAMAAEYKALYEIHSLPVRKIPSIPLYSASNLQPFVMTEAGIAGAVARNLCSELDFPRLVDKAYSDGARVFIELGAGSNCARWIDEILRGKAFLSVSANRKGVDDAASILRVLARLTSHLIPFNPEPLIQNRFNVYEQLR